MLGNFRSFFSTWNYLFRVFVNFNKQQIDRNNMAELTTQEKEHVQLELDKLNEAAAKATDFEEKLELKDKIHNMQMIMNGIKPYGSIQYFCEGCGS